MSEIARQKGVNVNIKKRTRQLNDTITYKYYFIAGSKKSQQLLRNYLNEYPLLSSKFLDFTDWCKIIDLNNNKSISKEDIINLTTKLKSGMNSKRTIFTWEHLDRI